MTGTIDSLHTSDLSGKKVLIVDDSVTVVKSVAKTLSGVGLVPLECHDTDTVVEDIQSLKPDLVLLDLGLPKISGFDWIKRIREVDALKLLPIIVITASRVVEDLANALKIGADDFVIKPFNETLLLARIHTHLRTHQLLVDIQQANLKIMEARDKEVEAEKWRTAVEMAGTFAHKLNQPLTSIVCYADMLLKSRGVEDEDFKAIKSIASESERMTILLRKIGDVAKLRSSPYVGDTTILDIEETSSEEDAGR